ncbi:MAG: hypothetical protein WCB96_08460 [Candidatus Aminicenantales bacterium]
MKRLFLGATLFILGLGVVAAVVPQQWSLTDGSDFWKGKFSGVASGVEGPLFLAAREEKKEGPAEEFYLSLAEARDGTLYLGTGHGGKIYRLAKDAPPELYFQAPEMDVTCLALDEQGLLYAGTSPNGRIYKITAKNKGETFFNPDEKYIWDLLPGPGGKMLAAVGEGGAVYEISSLGEGRALLKVNQSHILCLARQANGDLLAGSAGNGLLYRLSSSGKASVLAEPSFEEVKGIALDGQGNIYLAACGTPVKAKKDEADKADSTAAAVEITVTADRASAGQKAAASASPSALIQVSGEGLTKKLWSSEDELIYDLVWDEAQKKIVFGTGGQGRLYAVDTAGQASLIVQKSSEQVSRLVPSAGKTYVLSNNPARLDILLSEQRMEGEYLSPVLDAKTLSSWGRIVWEGELPSGTTLQLQTRSGNSNEPSSTWSEWSPPYQKAEGEQILSPKARYLQFRALFKTNSGRLSPKLSKVELYYLQVNMAPVMDKLVFLEPNEVYLKPPGSKDVIWGRPESLESRVKAEDDEDDPLKLLASIKKSKAQGYRTLVWGADDENEDNLVYSIFARREDESQWRLLEKDWPEQIYAIDTVSLPDGIYVFKVVASDRLSNPPGSALQGEKVSRRLTIDNTAPLLKNVQVTKDGAKLKVGFQAEDALSPILEARVLVRPSAWQEVFPSDGICDSNKESFSFSLDHPAGADNLITIMVKDAHNNRAVFRQIF